MTNRRRYGLAWLLVSAILALAVAASAQSPALPADRLQFDQSAPDLATANAYQYRVYLDGATTGNLLTVSCAGAASPYVCTAQPIALTPGTHTATVTSAVVLPDGRVVESAPSAALTVRVIIAPQSPSGLRIVP